MYQFKTKGTCAQLINFDVRDGKVHDVAFQGGCNGNLKAIGKLVEGMPAQQLIDTLKGVQCGPRSTSCSDQLATAVQMVLDQEK